MNTLKLQISEKNKVTFFKILIPFLLLELATKISSWQGLPKPILLVLLAHVTALAIMFENKEIEKTTIFFFLAITLLVVGMIFLFLLQPIGLLVMLEATITLLILGIMLVNSL